MEILGLDAHERGQPIVNLTSIQPCFPKCTAAWHCRPSLDDANRDYLDYEGFIRSNNSARNFLSKPHLYCGRQCGNGHTFLLPSWEFVRFNLAILARVYFRNINDWDVGRFHQPQVAAHLFCAAGNTVKLDIDRSDDDDRVEKLRFILTCLYTRSHTLNVHHSKHEL